VNTRQPVTSICPGRHDNHATTGTTLGLIQITPRRSGADAHESCTYQVWLGSFKQNFIIGYQYPLRRCNASSLYKFVQLINSSGGHLIGQYAQDTTSLAEPNTRAECPENDGTFAGRATVMNGQ
jgi:hypothetical protein